jgi:hypothetical protein
MQTDASTRRMTRLWMRGTLTILLLASCDSQTPPPPDPTFQVLETLTVRGICHEDHTTVTGEYEGTIVDREHTPTRQRQVDGQVTRIVNAADQDGPLAQHMDNPYRYVPPASIVLYNVTIDQAKQSALTAGGYSGKAGHFQYEATCELQVLTRSTGNSTPQR